MVSSRLLISHGIVVDGAGNPPAPETAVLVRDGFVHAVGDGALRESVPRGETLREIDATGRTVMPGLIDAHCHMTYGESRIEEEIDLYTSPESRTRKADLHAQKVLRVGVTGISQPGGSYYIVVALRGRLAPRTRGGRTDGARHRIRLLAHAVRRVEVSRICAELDDQVAAFRGPSLEAASYPSVFLDATYCKARGRRPNRFSGCGCLDRGCAATGAREGLGVDVGDSENGAFWTAVLRSLKARGGRRAAGDRRCAPGFGPSSTHRCWVRGCNAGCTSCATCSPRRPGRTPGWWPR